MKLKLKLLEKIIPETITEPEMDQIVDILFTVIERQQQSINYRSKRFKIRENKGQKLLPKPD
jgi:hypothetical protein